MGENAWYMVGANRWYIVGENYWYIVGENARYIFGANWWYIIAREVTPDKERLLVRGKRYKQRTAYITSGASDALSDWLVFRGSAPGPLFWPINKGGKFRNKRLSDQAVYNMLVKRRRQSGIKSFSPHDMRRTFVSDLLDAGADIATVSKMAGHANVQTTARYDRRPEEAKQKAAKLLHVPYQRRRL